MKLGDAIKARRRDRGWTLAELSRRSGVSYNYLWEIEHNRKQPTLPVVKRIADALGVTLNDLVYVAA